ncbi:NmrA/HSCARG family protein [Nonomuraea cavernae]|uniref:NmrA family transcriptional regulator n=1 Tax=Nonomuraea cavernae TaxID=2045107 RepID=A0A918DGF7_9ACTN|nr:NmrA/HSCARG family protein [Nonomuraea cavernae]MCA2185055.1 NmrA/HSCARG family protein [Nonomuraea cavernae]GGO65270.1 NmrA family transcriptional regulator [Nonomuraea cavernae]
MSNKKTVLVTGATGGQGGAVARRLLDDGWAVRALVRGPDKQKARELKALGAELVTGDLDDPESLRAAAQGAHGVFSVQPADVADPHPAVEVRQGRNVADAAQAAGVAHLVYSSVGAAGRESGVAHFETKTEIEAHIDAIGVPATVLRPVFFMENWPSMLPQAENGERVGSIALDADTSLQMIALVDIGRIAADAFDTPAEFIGKKIEIAGDELTVRQIGEVFTRVDGIPTRFERQPIEELRAGAEEVAKMFDWFDEKGYQADIAALRERYPELLTLEAWLSRNR